ncbi:MAG: hypothetical protein U0414_17415 [Polyangiaceae bacterium]
MNALEAAATTNEAADLRRDVKGGVEILGPPLDRAREALGAFWREDETKAFTLVMVRAPADEPVFVLYAVDSNGRPLLSGGVDAKLRLVPDVGARIGAAGVATLIKIAKK